MSTYEEFFPPEGGPFKIGDHLVKETMDRTDPVMVVTLDFGAFRRVWEMVEADAKRHYPTRETLSTARAELRAVEAFRKVWATFAGSPMHTAPPKAEKPVEAPPRRQFKRKTEPTPSEPEPAPSRRQFKRKN